MVNVDVFQSSNHICAGMLDSSSVGVAMALSGMFVNSLRMALNSSPRMVSFSIRTSTMRSMASRLFLHNAEQLWMTAQCWADAWCFDCCKVLQAK